MFQNKNLAAVAASLALTGPAAPASPDHTSGLSEGRQQQRLYLHRDSPSSRPQWQTQPMDGPETLPMERALSVNEGVQSLLERADILLVGENHRVNERVYPEIIARAKESGIDTLYLEFPSDLQPLLDSFHQTGSVRQLLKELPALTPLKDIQEILTSAREHGIRVVAIDVPLDMANTAGMKERMDHMTARVSEIPFTNKAVIVTGYYHAENRLVGTLSLRTRLSTTHTVASLQLLSSASVQVLLDEANVRGLDPETVRSQTRAWSTYFGENAPENSFYLPSVALGGLNYFSPLSHGWNTYQTGFDGVVFLSQGDAVQILDFRKDALP